MVASSGTAIVNLKALHVDRIWRVQSSVEIDEIITPTEAYERLEPLFCAPGTELSREGDTLSYKKSNPAAQDKLATFTSGTLHVGMHEGRTSLSYEVSSTALLLCFLAPLLFIGLGQLAEGLNMLDPPVEESERGEAAKDKDEKEDRSLHWIDQMLGAPAPETKEEREKRKEEEESEEDKEAKHSSTPAFVLAGLFLAIYLVGRILEPYLLKRTFRRALTDPEYFRAMLTPGDASVENAAPSPD